MRRIAAALVLPLTAVAVLAGCGSSSPAASPNAAVAVTGAFGHAPAVRIPARKAGGDLAIKTEIHGTGEALPAGDVLLGNFAVYVWSGTSHKLLDSSFARAPQLLPAQLPLPGLTKALRGQRIGSRILAVLPPSQGYGSRGNPQLGISGTDTTVWVVDLIRAFSPSAAASGPHLSSGGGSLPTVTAASAGAPTITIPKRSPPATLIAKTLIKGTGPAVANGETVVAQVQAVIWRTQKPFYSTWPTAAAPSGAPFSFQLGGTGVIPGWNKGLVGQTVGSRVMLVIPPADGYGKTGNTQAGITGTDTLVFVVDIVGAVPPAA